MKIHTSILALFFLAALVAPAVARDHGASAGWAEYRNERFGFSLRYPADVFGVEKVSESGDGQVFAADGGRARLLVGALPNDTGQSSATYQDYVVRHSYAEYQVSYRRLSGSWFVLSGEGNGKTFYEKVMFSCAGRLINSFAMIYPTEQRHIFDPIVEGIEATFQPGKDCSGAPDNAQRSARILPNARTEVRRPGPRSALADRIARQRGYDVIVVLRRTTPPYDRRVVRGYVSR